MKQLVVALVAMLGAGCYCTRPCYPPVVYPRYIYQPPPPPAIIQPAPPPQPIIIEKPVIVDREKLVVVKEKEVVPIDREKLVVVEKEKPVIIREPMPQADRKIDGCVKSPPKAKAEVRKKPPGPPTGPAKVSKTKPEGAKTAAIEPPCPPSSAELSLGEMEYERVRMVPGPAPSR